MPSRQEIISNLRLTETATVAAGATFTGKPGAVFDFRFGSVLLPDNYAIALVDGQTLNFVSTLAGLSDVAVSGDHNPTDGQALVWSLSLGKWIPGTVAGGGSGGGFANPMTTAGDIIVGGAAGAATRLPKGRSGQVLTVKPDGTLGWVTPSGGGTGPGAGTDFTYVSDGDANGVLYHLGWMAGGGSTWANPVPAVVTLTANTAEFSGANLNLLTNRALGASGSNILALQPGGGTGAANWFDFDFGADRLLKPNAFSFRQRNNGAALTTQITLYGVDGGGVEHLISVCNITNQSAGAWTTTSFSPPSVGYQIIRAKRTAATSSGETYFTADEAEFYGNLVEP